MKHRFQPYWFAPGPASPREQDYRQVQDILDGREELWEPLYREAHPFVLQAAARADLWKLLSPADYQDLAHQAFTMCWDQLERYRGESRFSRWVGGYAKNLTRNRCSRVLTQRRNQELLESSARRAMDGSDPLDIVIRLERDQCLWRAFFDLSPVNRYILSARVLHRMAPRTIARDVGLTRREVLDQYESSLFALRRGFIRYYSFSAPAKQRQI